MSWRSTNTWAGTIRGPSRPIGLCGTLRGGNRSSEFGGEALYGQHGAADTASSWSEEYQEALYRDNLRMFEYIPNLRGVSPWILFDFRSPFRFHPTNQEGWNRKGLVSDRGYRKKAWYLMKAYYDKR